MDRGWPIFSFKRQFDGKHRMAPVRTCSPSDFCNMHKSCCTKRPAIISGWSLFTSILMPSGRVIWVLWKWYFWDFFSCRRIISSSSWLALVAIWSVIKTAARLLIIKASRYAICWAKVSSWRSQWDHANGFTPGNLNVDRSCHGFTKSVSCKIVLCVEPMEWSSINDRNNSAWTLIDRFSIILLQTLSV